MRTKVDTETPCQSLWSRTACPASPCPPLTGNVTTEVAIIGAGYTGLSAALHLAERGREVVVLEAVEAGHGASGRNTGWWVPFWVSMPPSKVKARFGEEAGQRFAQMMLDGARLVPELVRRHRIVCDIRPVGVVLAARSGKTVSMLQGIAQEWRAMGVHAEVLDSPAMRRFIATDRYVGGVHYLDSGHLNPMSYCRGLAAAAERFGARIHGRSPVHSITAAEKGWTVRTPSGVVSAQQVLVAVNISTGLIPELRSKYLSVRFGMHASAPFPDKGRSYLPGGALVTDIDAKDLFGVAFDGEGRLVSSAFPPFNASRPAAETTRLYWRMFRSTFPDAPSEIPWEYVWQGHDSVPADGLTKVVSPAPGLFAVFGYAGNGIAQGSIVGREVAEWMTTGDRQRVRVPPAAAKSIPGAAVISAFVNRLVMPAMGHVIYR